MRVPTYLKKENYKLVKEEVDFLTVTVMNKEENGKHNEFFDIYYFGELFGESFLEKIIFGTFDDETCETVPCKIIAKCVKTGKEILLFDEAKYGYNSLFCDEFDMDTVSKRNLSKLDIPTSKIKIEFGYSIDFEGEKEDFELDENDCLKTINGECMSWEDVKKNAFDFIRIWAIDDKETVREICELELA